MCFSSWLRTSLTFSMLAAKSIVLLLVSSDFVRSVLLPAPPLPPPKMDIVSSAFGEIGADVVAVDVSPSVSS